MRSFKFILSVGLISFAIGILFVKFHVSPPESVPQIKTRAADALNYAERDENLQNQADALLPLFDSMSPVPVYLKNEPILSSGTNTERSLAYTTCDAQQFPSIIFKRDFYQRTNQKKLTNILKHELTHAWLCRQQLMSVGHGAAFHKKFKSIGGWGS